MADITSTNMTLTKGDLVPGELQTAEGEIVLNAGMPTVVVKVANIGDRPVQIGSHYHFYEANEALQFEREQTLGYRLNIPAGTATRFEPGQIRTVELVSFGGSRSIYGFQGKVMADLAPIDEAQKDSHHDNGQVEC